MSSQYLLIDNPCNNIRYKTLNEENKTHTNRTLKRWTTKIT